MRVSPHPRSPLAPCSLVLLVLNVTSNISPLCVGKESFVMVLDSDAFSLWFSAEAGGDPVNAPPLSRLGRSAPRQNTRVKKTERKKNSDVLRTTTESHALFVYRR